MSELSPAAQAVLDAYMNNCGWLDGPFEKDYRCAAAVLRAAADQAAPEKQLKDIAYIHESYLEGMRDALACIEIIAKELEFQ